MKSTSKITVKHFINDKIHASYSAVRGYNSEGKFDKDLLQHPVYIKITFLRKTTQIKSLIEGDYFTIDEAKKNHSEQMAAEASMTEAIIKNEYSLHGDRFSLKGIGDKCNAYKRNLYYDFITSYLWEEFSNAVKKTKSPFMRLLLQKLDNVPAIIHYEAATRLLGDNPAIEKLQSKFNSFKDIETLFSKNRYLKHIQVFEWKFGTAKEHFSSYAIKKGFNFNSVSEMVAIIDEQIILWE